MEKLFGIPLDILMVVLLVLISSILAVVALYALVSRIMLKIGLRNIPRRPAHTVLIVVGLMLSALIMSAAFGTGDTISHTIRTEVIDGLGQVDEILFARQGFTSGSQPYFEQSVFENLEAQLADNPNIEAIAPLVNETASALNIDTNRNESRLQVWAASSNHLAAFGELQESDSDTIRTLDDLPPGQVYLNEEAANELDAAPGHTIQLFLDSGLETFQVNAIVSDATALGGSASRMLLPLERGQQLFGQPGMINQIIVSNQGDATEGAELSEEVTRELRRLLADPEVAAELKALLSQDEPLAAIAALPVADPDSPQHMEELTRLREELAEPGVSTELTSLLSDADVADQIERAMNSLDDETLRAEIISLLGDISQLRVLEVKRSGLDEAELVASIFTSFFVVFGSFSIVAGILLIFLVFVMLAAARRPEMGMARAIGAKRSQLVQAFVFEGTAYSLVASLIGALIGVGVGFVLVSTMANILSNDELEINLVRKFELRSFIVTYCLGLLITLVTVTISSYQVSRLNIVAAIRDIPDVAFAAPQVWWKILLSALLRPFIFVGRALRSLVRRQWMASLGNLLLALAWLPGIIPWIIDIVIATVRVGWLAFLAGVFLIWIGIETNQAAFYTVGVTAFLLGVGLGLRSLFQRSGWGVKTQNTITAVLVLAVSLFWVISGIIQEDAFTIGIAVAIIAFEGLRQLALSRERAVSDSEARNAFTFAGLSLLLFWLSPFESLDYIVPDLDASVEMFLISGVCLVAAAVLTVIYNSDLLINGITAVFGRMSGLRPVLRTAVAYPLNAPFRTGLTVAMFALIIFTLIVMSIIISANDNLLADTDKVTGNWDVSGSINYNNPVDDMEDSIASSPRLRPSQFQAIGGYVTLPAEVRQVGASDQAWKFYQVSGANDAYLKETGYGFTITTPEYGSTPDEIWESLRTKPGLAVIDALGVPSGNSFGTVGMGDTFMMEGFYLEDDEMPPTTIQVREPMTGVVTELTVIAVINQVTDLSLQIFTSKQVLDELSPVALPVTQYRFRLAEGEDPQAVAEVLEVAFLENGMEARSLEQWVRDSQAQNRALNTLLQGFMSLGLLVGIAALGVITSRAVVERRQQIGVLRAIGFTRAMVYRSFLLEAGFVALLGIVLGIVLGIALSYNLVNSVSEDLPGFEFSVPWLSLVVIAILAYAFSLLTTYLPARQASRVNPADALRYE